MQAIAPSINNMFLELIIYQTSTKILGKLQGNFPGISTGAITSRINLTLSANYFETLISIETIY
jgi:hypothetical protein